MRNENPLVVVCRPYARCRSEYYRQRDGPQGNDVANASASLVADDERPVQEKVTGSDGQVRFTDIAPSKYTLRPKAAGEGPGRLRYLTFAARHCFGFGLLQVSFSKADARDMSDGTPTPEAPRLIVDGLATLDHLLPFHLRARGEFEYVGAKPLGELINGVSNSEAFGVPNTEVRGAVLRTFRQGRMDIGVNFLLAKGDTGQTTEQLEPSHFTSVVGVRLHSYLSASYTYRFQLRQAH